MSCRGSFMAPQIRPDSRLWKLLQPHFRTLPPLKNKQISGHVFITRTNQESYPGRPTNETLELLGDAVLGMITIDTLLARLPRLQEGEISNMKHVLTNNSVLGQIACGYRFDTRPEYLEALRLQPKLGSKVLADMFEAYVGAVYRERGLDPVARWLTPIINIMINHYATLYGYLGGKKVRYVERDVRKDSRNPLTPLNSDIHPSVDHCEVREPFDYDAKNEMLNRLRGVSFELSDVTSLPDDERWELRSNGNPLRAKKLIIDGTVCATGEGFSQNDCETRCLMALKRSLARLEQSPKKLGPQKGPLSKLAVQLAAEHILTI